MEPDDVMMMEPEPMEPEMEPEADEQEQSMPPEEFIAYVTGSMNLAADLDEDKLAEIAQQVLDDYALDKESMSEWFEKMERAIELAKLVKSEKTYPFKRAANVKYPLITSAALQFNARAYPAIVPADEVVKAKTFGADPQGQKAARGKRISAHMSWQLINEIEEWEEETDSLLVQLPIVGTMVRKVWYDPVQGRSRCRLLDAGAFVVNNKIKNLTDAPRCSEELRQYPSEITTNISSGWFVDFEYDITEGDKQEPQEFIEQHCRIDLDGDGYDEPYIVTVHKDSETVVRVVADFEADDVRYTREERMVPIQVQGTDIMGYPVMQEVMQPQPVVTGITAINRSSYFIPYKFMPSMDGGFHGTGLGILLGDISDTINSIINMLLDAGHMSSLGGGFIGSEFRIKGGNSRFEPGEWKLAGATGGEIRNSIVPMTFPGPDAVLFQMLGMLIEAGKEISSTKDIMTGDAGDRAQTATTTLALIEQGMMVFTAAYKRIFRGLKREFKMLAKINARSVTAEQYNAFHDEVDEQGQPVMHDPAQDYAAMGMDVIPVADPRSVTKMQEMAKAELLQTLAQQGLVNPAAVGKRVLEAADIADTQELLPQPDPMAQQMQQFQAQMAMQMAQADYTQKMVDIDKTLAEIEEMKAAVMKTMADAGKTEAETAMAPERLRLDAMTLLLKERRDDMEQTLRVGLAGMAAESRDRSDARRSQGNAGPSAAGGGTGLLGGQAMAGGGAPGFGPPSGMA